MTGTSMTTARRDGILGGRAAICAGALLVLFGSAAFARAPQSPSGALPPAAATSSAPVIAGGPVRVVNTYVFRTGINELKLKVDLLNKEFDPTSRQLASLADQINALETEIQNQGPQLSPAALSQKNDRLEDLKRQYQRMGEDTSALASKRWNEETGAIYAKIEKFMTSYCQERGIIVVFDLAGAAEKQIIQYVGVGTDMTQEFVDAYNKFSATPPPAAKRP